MNQNHKTILINEFNLTKKREKGRFKLKIFASRNMVFSLLYYPCDFVGINWSSNCSFEKIEAILLDDYDTSHNS